MKEDEKSQNHKTCSKASFRAKFYGTFDAIREERGGGRRGGGREEGEGEREEGGGRGIEERGGRREEGKVRKEGRNNEEGKISMKFIDSWEGRSKLQFSKATSQIDDCNDFHGYEAGNNDVNNNSRKTKNNNTNDKNKQLDNQIDSFKKAPQHGGVLRYNKLDALVASSKHIIICLNVQSI